MENIENDFMNLDHTNMDTETLWNFFKTKIHSAIDKYIPHKFARPKSGLPWINQEIKSLIRKRDRLYKRVKKENNNNKLKHHFKEVKKAIQKKIRQSFWTYIDEIISPEEDKSQKKFWSFIKSLKKTILVLVL